MFILSCSIISVNLTMAGSEARLKGYVVIPEAKSESSLKEDMDMLLAGATGDSLEDVRRMADEERGHLVAVLFGKSPRVLRGKRSKQEDYNKVSSLDGGTVTEKRGLSSKEIVRMVGSSGQLSPTPQCVKKGSLTVKVGKL